MSGNKSSISKADSYEKIGEFWDTHDVTEFWDQTKEVQFDVEIESQKTYYPVETSLSAKVTAIAKKHGVSTETLLNLWIERNVAEELAIRK
ncbi:MAG: CopG family antitoxin [Pyrinomonadaceae bacterium]